MNTWSVFLLVSISFSAGFIFGCMWSVWHIEGGRYNEDGLV
jgi:hypothetical protein